MSNPIQFASYTDSVRTTQDTAPVLAEQLVTAAPRDADAQEKKALAEVTEAAQHVADVVSARERATPTQVRPKWIALSSVWTGAYEVCSGKARLDTGTPQGDGAQHLMKALFFDGVPVSQRDATQSYGISRRMLARIDGEKLVKTFESIIGPELLAQIRSRTDDLGEAIGAGDTRAPSVPSGNAVQEALSRFGRKVGAYGRVLAAKVDEDDARSVQRFLDAVAPIDAIRASFRSTGRDDATDEPASPSPELGAPSAEPHA